MKGYRWYVNVGVFGRHSPTDRTFATIEDVRQDAERNYGISRECYGIDLVDDNEDGWIDVLESIQTTEKIEWIDHEGYPYFD